MYLLKFLVPESHVEAVKTAIFNTGAGSIGAYRHCAWQTLGQGQFMPLSGSQAYIGQVNTLETVEEFSVEIVCESHQIHDAVAALKAAHPYEVPAYAVIKLEPF